MKYFPFLFRRYEEKYQCSLSGGSNACTLKTRTELTNDFVQSPLVEASVKAVFAFAQTIVAVCANSGNGLCPSLQSMDSAEFHNQIRNLDFTFPNNFGIQSLRNQRIRFNVNGDPEISEFDIYNYNNRSGSFSFENVSMSFIIKCLKCLFIVYI